MTVPAVRSPVAVAFGLRTRALRTGRGWSLEAMAARPGLNISAIRRVERGEGTSLAMAGRIAAAFGMTVAEMLAPEVPG